MTCDISAVITGHREGRLAVASLRSLWATVEHARENGISVEVIFVLDKPDDATREVFQQFCRDDCTILETEFGDQGAARNLAVSKANGTKIAFLDGDDLWSYEWLTSAYAFLKQHGDNVIAHPEYNYFFEGQATIFRHVDQDADEFSMDLLRIGNYWDALCLCDKSVYTKYPFYKREIDKGWAFEDWYWNCETIQGGLHHKVVPDSVLFKRRQRMSQTVRASGSKAQIRRNALSSYSNEIFLDTEVKK